MKKIFALPLVAALSIFCSCQKQESDAERRAEIDRQVQQRLDAEHQAQQKEQLAQRESELEAREKALRENEGTASTPNESEDESDGGESRGTSEERRPTASYDTFYTKLDTYGDWRETSDYGYVWQPRQAQQSRTWRPYTDGRWAYTDAGWTWISDEPFGWATYHYGRWIRLRNVGWVWIPGNEWAPAWVSWRKGDDYVGWAPLPPEARFDRRSGIHNWADNYYDIGPDQYCFVPTRDFGAQRIERTLVPTDRNITIINQTTNVTNITYNNTMVVNHGPNYDELRTRTQQPIERLRLEREINVNVNAGEPRSVIRGEVLAVLAPVFGPAQSAQRPRRLKESIAHVTADRGWEGISDQQAAQKVRAKMKSESTPPRNAPPRTFAKPAQTARPIMPIATATPVESVRPKLTPQARLTPTPEPRLTSTPLPSVSPSATPVIETTATPFRPRQRPRMSPTESESPPPAETSKPSPQPRIAAPEASDSQTTATPSDSSADATTQPMSRRDKRELKREEKAERKRDRKERREGVGASPTPTLTPAG